MWNGRIVVQRNNIDCTIYFPIQNYTYYFDCSPQSTVSLDFNKNDSDLKEAYFKIHSFINFFLRLKDFHL